MPVRILVYIGRLYEKVIQLQKIYGSTLVKIPAPQFVVLYNGEDDCPNHRVMRLSDAFITKSEYPALELKADLHNINYGKSDILQKSPSLNEYSTFIHYIRQEQKENEKPLDEAISAAVNRAVQEGIMKKFLQEHGSEVRNMLFEEWNWEQYVAAQREEGREEGRIEGENRILRQAVAIMMSSMPPEKIADALCVSLSRVQAILQQTP